MVVADSFNQVLEYANNFDWVRIILEGQEKNLLSEKNSSTACS